MEFLYLLTGLIIGGIAAWFLAQSRAGQKLKAEEKRNADLQSNLKSAETRIAERDTEKKELKQNLELKQTEIQELNNQLTQSQADQRHTQEKLNEQKKELEKLHEKFSKEFENLANKILDEKSKKFTDQNKTNLDQLLKPLNDRIREFQTKVEQSDKAGAKRGAALGEQLQNLQQLNQQITKDAQNLTQALRGENKAQGNWGEMQLESILQKAGLQEDVHYFKEKSFQNEEGQRQRLDFIIKLPDEKHLVLDSKVSLTAYTNYFEAETEEGQERYLKQHVQSMHTHIKNLGAKNYQDLYQIETPDYVLMFVANEPALTTALKEDPQLYEKALDRNLVLVSTTTLLATLRTISYIWKQDSQNKNAEEIARQAGLLYDKFAGFVDDLKKLGNQMETTQKTYRESMNKLVEGRGNLVKKTEDIRKLGINNSKKIDKQIVDRSESSVSELDAPPADETKQNGDARKDQEDVKKSAQLESEKPQKPTDDQNDSNDVQ